MLRIWWLGLVCKEKCEGIEWGKMAHEHPIFSFVYFKGKGVEVIDTKIVGESKENADIVVVPYPSDHRAVVASFTLPNQQNLEKATSSAAK